MVKVLFSADTLFLRNSTGISELKILRQTTSEQSSFRIPLQQWRILKAVKLQTRSAFIKYLQTSEIALIINA
jgi:hypothetical protein